MLEALGRRSQHAEGDRRDACAAECAPGRKALAGERSRFFGFRRERICANGAKRARRRRRSPSKEIDRRDRSARNAARKAKNFAEADRIRDELAAMGVVLKDSKDGTTWEVAR